MKNNSIQIWKKASEIFADIADYSVGSAIKHLDEIPDLDSKVRHAVITLMNAENQASNFFSEKIVPVFSKLGLNKVFAVGDKIANYELIAELGSGGMSQVFKAQRLDFQQQKPVAIKIFTPTQRSQELLNHFINEQKLLAQLSHPNIVDMLHGGTTEDNIAYLTMALVEDAQPIDKYCKSQKLSIRKSIQLIITCANALSYLHTNLIIHRDLKPDNVLVDKNGNIKIVDFGIAKLINNDLSGNKTTILALTPGYAAPEQIKGEQISTKVDIFSLAVIALDLLCETKPLPKKRLFNACNDDEYHIKKVIKSIAVDNDLKNILNQALQQNPSNRYQTIEQFSEDLQAWLDYKPVKATGDTIFYRLSKFAQRRKALFASITTLIITLFLAFIALSWQYRQTLKEKHRAIEIKNFMLNIFSSADPEKTTQGKQSVLDLLQMATKKLNTKQFSDNHIKNELLTNIGTSFLNLGVEQKGEEILLKVTSNEPENIQALLRLAQYYIASSQQKDAKNTLLKLDQLLGQKNKMEIEKYQLDLLKAKQTAQQGDNKRALQLAKKTQKNFAKQNNDLGYLQSTHFITEIYEKTGKLKQAIEIGRSGIEYVRNSLTPATPDLLRLRIRLAVLQSMLGQFDTVQENIDEVIAIIELNLGKQHPMMITTLVEKANIYLLQTKNHKALETAKKAYEIAVKRYSKTSKLAQHALFLVTMSQHYLKQNQIALKNYQQLLHLSELNYGKDNYITHMVKIGYSEYLSKANHVETAINFAKKTQIEICNQKGKNSELCIMANNNYFEILFLYSHLSEDSVASAERNSILAENTFGKNNPNSIYARTIFNKMKQKIKNGQ